MNTFLSVKAPRFYGTTLSNPFEPIGMGKPLIVSLHTVYVGDLKNSILGNKQSILITSAIKDKISYASAPRAVNQVYQKIDDRELLYPKATNEGTELIHYVKAFDGSKLNFTIDVKANRFKENVIEDISNTMSVAAGIPVFLPYAPFILAGSQLLKISGNALNRALEKVPVLSYDFNVLDDTGGVKNTTAGYLVGVNKNASDLFQDGEVVEDEKSPGNVYLKVNGEKYLGDQPYIILSLDGRKKEKYENFSATHASALLLKKYYGTDQSTDVGDLQEMLKLFNDYSFLEKAKKTQKRIEKSSDAKEIEKLTKQLNAYQANISNEDILNAFKAMLSTSK